LFSKKRRGNLEKERKCDGRVGDTILAEETTTQRGGVKTKPIPTTPMRQVENVVLYKEERGKREGEKEEKVEKEKESVAPGPSSIGLFPSKMRQSSNCTLRVQRRRRGNLGLGKACSPQGTSIGHHR